MPQQEFTEVEPTVIGKQTQHRQSAMRRRSRVLISATVSFREPNQIPISKYQYIVLILTSYVNLISGISFTLLATFFVENAASHGLSKLNTGFVVSIHSAAAMFAFPFVEYKLSYLGPKLMMLSGLLIAATCTGLFGVLDMVSSTNTYFALGLLLRGAHGYGTAAYLSASYGILVDNWSGSRLPLALGLFEFFNFIGMTFGPVLGATLYSLYGFGFPFYIVSAIFISSAILFGTTLRNHFEDEYEVFESTFSDDTSIVCENIYNLKNIKKLLQNGLFMTATVVLISAWACLHFNMIFISDHLKILSVEADEISVSLWFAAMVLSYTIFSVLWGQLCGRNRCSRSLMFMGIFLTSTCYFFLGPTPWFAGINIYVENTTSSVVVLMIAFGAFLSAATIPTCSQLMEGARRERCDDECQTFIGVWYNSAIFCGKMVGPVIGGLLLNIFNNFAEAVSFFAVAFLVLSMLCGFLYVFLFYRRQWLRRDETFDQSYIRRNQRNRQMRRHRIRSTLLFSVGPRALSESLSAARRYQWNELEGG